MNASLGLEVTVVNSAWSDERSIVLCLFLNSFRFCKIGNRSPKVLGWGLSFFSIRESSGSLSH